MGQRQSSQKWEWIYTQILHLSQINSKWILDINVNYKDNIGENLENTGIGNNFLDVIPKAWYIKEMIS